MVALDLDTSLSLPGLFHHWHNEPSSFLIFPKDSISLINSPTSEIEFSVKKIHLEHTLISISDLWDIYLLRLHFQVPSYFEKIMFLF